MPLNRAALDRAAQYREMIRRTGVAAGNMPPPLPAQVGNTVQRYGYAGPTLPQQTQLAPGAAPPPMLPPKVKVGPQSFAPGQAPPPLPAQVGNVVQRYGIAGPVLPERGGIVNPPIPTDGGIAPAPRPAPAGSPRFGIGGPLVDYLARRRRTLVPRNVSRGGLY